MSSNDMPELGSKISLISKADIRYEGKLYTVDPQDCTIALANVRSFGTEDRKTAHPVPAQNQVYDYILFRATDIKDISVVPPTQLLCDPAIVQLSSSITNRGFGSSTTSSVNQDYPPMLSGLYQHPAGGASAGGFNPMQSNINPLARPQPQKSVLDFLTASRSSTPGGLRKPSPTVDQGTQANTRQKNTNIVGNRNQQDHRDNNQQQRRMNQNQHQQGQQQQQRTRTYQPQGQNQNRGWQPLNNHQLQGMNMNNRQPLHQHQQHQQHQQQRNSRPRQNNTGRQFTRAPGPRPKQPTQPLKFESDYDFDKANSEFEELKSEISKLKLTDDAEAPAPLMNGDAEKKDDSGNETALTTEEAEEQYFYNKTKSFFDNISCEAIERSKGRSQRTDWRKERILNSETFGVASARRNNYNRGRGGGFYYGNRGGFFQRNYRNQQGGYRNRTGNKSPAQRTPQPQAATA